jgi:hypothetical protein
MLELKPIFEKIYNSRKFWPGLCIFFCVLLAILGTIAGRLLAGALENRNDQGLADYGIKNASGQNMAVPDGNGASSSEISQEKKIRRRIDGAFVSEGKENSFPYGVMIENHVDARPPAGLSRANLVYEAEAEGGITRFLAFYASGEKIGKIGPVRSARPYYLDWAQEYGALYAHCGGSPDALALIIKNKVYDFNEFFRGKYFWRDQSRSAPHNVYTSSDRINEYLDANSSKNGDYEAWSYKDDAVESERGTSSEIIVNFKKPFFTVRWIYDGKTNDYLRMNGGEIHKDEDGSEIRAKNIMIEFVKSYPTDEKGRMETRTTGGGKGIFCFDGKCKDGEWRKPSARGRTVFFDSQNAEVSLNAGTIWIEAVPIGYKVEEL